MLAQAELTSFSLLRKRCDTGDTQAEWPAGVVIQLTFFRPKNSPENVTENCPENGPELPMQK